jgi:hypothetical protein
MKLGLVALSLISALASGTALAADAVAPLEGLPPDSDRWKFQATIYGWLPALSGDVGIKNLPTVSVDVTAKELLDNLDAALMGAFIATNGEWSFLGDIVWSKISDEANVGRRNATASFEQTLFIGSGAIGYKLPLGLPENIDISATAGFRYQHLNATVGLSADILPIDISREGSQDWIDPTIGLTLHYAIDEKWFVNALVDIGGFGVGSDFTSQGFAAVGYKWTPSVSTAIGYRAIYTDYNKDGFVWDTTLQGVYTGISLYF